MRLKELRKSKGLTQKEFAQIINVAPTTYLGYEKELYEPNLETLKLIADYYGVSLDYICDHTMKESDFSYLNEKQKKIVEIVAQLNDKNTDNVLYYVKGVLSTQKKD